jgi:hypothetical protein
MLAVLQGVLNVTNNLQSPSPYIINFPFGNPTLNATSVFFDPFFQALNTGSTITLPANPSYAICVLNLSTTANLSVQFTPVGNPATIVQVGPGGIVIPVFDPNKAGPGVSSLLLTGIGGTVPAMVLAAA